MNSPTKSAPTGEQWTCLKTVVSEPDDHGNISMTFAFRDPRELVFLVTIDGPMAVTGEDYVLALRAAQARIVAAAAGAFSKDLRLGKPN